MINDRDALCPWGLLAAAAGWLTLRGRTNVCVFIKRDRSEPRSFRGGRESIERWRYGCPRVHLACAIEVRTPVLEVMGVFVLLYNNELFKTFYAKLQHTSVYKKPYFIMQT